MCRRLYDCRTFADASSVFFRSPLSVAGANQKIVEFASGTDRITLAYISTFNSIGLYNYNGATLVGGIASSFDMYTNRWMRVGFSLQSGAICSIFMNGNTVASGTLNTITNTARSSSIIYPSSADTVYIRDVRPSVCFLLCSFECILLLAQVD